jgi:hypothetical protein
VGARGFEPRTPSLSATYSNQLSYAPSPIPNRYLGLAASTAAGAFENAASRSWSLPFASARLQNPIRRFGAVNQFPRGKRARA